MCLVPGLCRCQHMSDLACLVCMQVYRVDDVMLTLQGLARLSFDPGPDFLLEAAELLLALGSGCTAQASSTRSVNSPVACDTPSDTSMCRQLWPAWRPQPASAPGCTQRSTGSCTRS